MYRLPGYRMLRTGGRVGDTLAKGRPYEWPLLYRIRDMGLKGSVFDVGASIGNHTVYLSAVCGLNVYAWEADPNLVKILRQNIALNRLNVTVFPWAASDRDGQMEYGDLKGQLIPGEGIQTGRIDDAILVDDLVVVKVDVEGMEPEALRGMVDNLTVNRPIVYTEIHTDEAADKVAEVLTPLGYYLNDILEMGSPMGEWLTRQH